ncbi:outer membrane lipoprotein-sorting protein [Halostagnicola bangensis]
MTRSRFIILFTAVALVVLTAGCIGLTDDGDDPGERLQQELAETEPPEALSATVETSTTIETANGSETQSTTEAVWLRNDGTSRTEAVSGETDGSDGGYVVVNDGDEVWHQDNETGSITSYETQTSNQSRLERIYEEQERYFERFDVQSVDETTIDDRDAHRVVFAPPQNETLERSIDIMVEETTYRIPLETSLEDASDEHAEEIEIWFDEETLFPLQYEMKSESTEFSVSYEDVSFDESFEDELFEFEPPADSEPVGITFPEFNEYDTVEDADSAVDFDVWEPDPETIPTDFEFDSVQGVTYPDQDRTQVTQTYRVGSERSLLVAIGDGPREIPVDGSSTTIGGVNATIGETDHGTELEWEYESNYYHLFGDAELEEQTLLEIAESLLR